MSLITRQERERPVLDLYKQGKTHMQDSKRGYYYDNYDKSKFYNLKLHKKKKKKKTHAA